MLFIGPNLGAGGAERQWSILLPGLRERGHDVHLLALDGGGPFLAPLQAAGVPAEVAGMRSQADVLPLLRADGVRRFAPQVIVSRGVSGAWVGTALAAFRRAAHVFNEHRQVGFELSPRREAMMRLVARRLDLVVGVTPEQGAAWVRRGVALDQVLAIPNGVPAAAPDASRSAIRAELGIDDTALVIVLTASMRPEKRIPDFVHAVRRVHAQDARVLGLVIGDGAQRPAVEAAAQGSPAIRLLGQRSDVGRILSACDVFALTSAYEAVPMAILEAMAAGLPVVATDVGALATMVESEHTGLLVAPGDVDAIA
ncbi:MAG: hypothetical protein QOG59_3031, partial [Solirubrobacteraceae bacterium]|nr:hypothetical protein [Solirubrobacteraceae bacterium]